MSLQKERDLDPRTQHQHGRWQTAIRVLDQVLPQWHYRARQLDLQPAPPWLKTAAVDGVNLFYNVEFSEGKSDKEINFIAIHEVGHVTFGHLWRMPKDIVEAINKKASKEQLSFMFRMWNRAQDYALHQVLKPLCDVHPDILEFPPDACFNPLFDDLPCETIYDLIKNDPAEKAAAGGNQVHMTIGGPGVPAPPGAIALPGGGWVLATDGEGNIIDLEAEQKKGNVLPNGMTAEEALQAATEAAEEADRNGGGWGSGHPTQAKGVRRVARNLRESGIDWYSRLVNYVVRMADQDYDWTVADRPYLTRGLIIPGMQSDVIEMVIAMDISPSITPEMLAQFCANIETIRGQLPDHILHVIWCDDTIRRTATVRQGEFMDWSSPAGGSTDFRPPFRWVEKQSINPRVFVYLTDAYGPFPDREPDYPVIWAVYHEGPNPPSVPWGIPMRFGEGRDPKVQTPSRHPGL